MTHYHYFTILYKFKIMSNYSRSRDYCTSGRHVVSMCVNVIKVSVYLQVCDDHYVVASSTNMPDPPRYKIFGNLYCG